MNPKSLQANLAVRIVPAKRTLRRRIAPPLHCKDYKIQSRGARKGANILKVKEQ